MLRRLYFLVPAREVGKKVVDELQRAVPLGGATGLLCGLIGLALEPHLVVYLGGMVGLNVGNTRHKAFAQAIERGELLVIADVPRERVEELSGRIRDAHPRAQVEGTDPRVFP